MPTPIRHARPIIAALGFAALALTGGLTVSAGPAAAQSWLFSPEPISPTPLRVEPRARAAIAVQPPLQPAATREAAAATEPGPSVGASALAPPAGTPLAAIPEPPRRPSDLPRVAEAPVAPAAQTGLLAIAPGIVEARAEPPAIVRPAAVNRAEPLSERAAVERLNAYLNSFTTLVGDFTQRAGGRQTTGQFYLQRPGRLRFDYDQPSNLLIVADGTSVAIKDRKLRTQDLYFLSQTPLKFLVASRIELGRDLAIKDVSVGADYVRVTVEDRATLGGTSQVTLVYDPKANTLRQWTIVDAGGAETTVVLNNLQTGKTPDPRLFSIDQQPGIDPSR